MLAATFAVSSVVTSCSVSAARPVHIVDVAISVDVLKQQSRFYLGVRKIQLLATPKPRYNEVEGEAEIT